MSSPDPHQQHVSSGGMGFFQTMPPWSKGVVFALTTIPMSVAISGMILNVNVGEHLGRYLDIQLAAQQRMTDESADRVIAEMNGMADRLTILEADTGKMLDWACAHASVQGLSEDKPQFCENAEGAFR